MVPREGNSASALLHRRNLLLKDSGGRFRHDFVNTLLKCRLV
jgi:hypothetical protein